MLRDGKKRAGIILQYLVDVTNYSQHIALQCLYQIFMSLKRRKNERCVNLSPNSVDNYVENQSMNLVRPRKIDTRNKLIAF